MNNWLIDWMIDWLICLNFVKHFKAAEGDLIGDRCEGAHSLWLCLEKLAKKLIGKVLKMPSFDSLDFKSNSCFRAHPMRSGRVSDEC